MSNSPGENRGCCFFIFEIFVCYNGLVRRRPVTKVCHTERSEACWAQAGICVFKIRGNRTCRFTNTFAMIATSGTSAL
jgi:hypothetical protein